MKYEKKINTRLYTNILILLLGTALLIAACFFDKPIVSVYGSVFFTIGILRIIKIVRIKKNPDFCKKSEIQESDERNIMLAHKARSLTFSISVFLAGIAVMVLMVLGMDHIAIPIAYVVCVLLIINVICYKIFQKIY